MSTDYSKKCVVFCPRALYACTMAPWYTCLSYMPPCDVPFIKMGHQRHRNSLPRVMSMYHGIMVHVNLCPSVAAVRHVRRRLHVLANAAAFVRTRMCVTSSPRASSPLLFLFAPLVLTPRGRPSALPCTRASTRSAGRVPHACQARASPRQTRRRSRRRRPRPFERAWP